jgi:hypothetical protein
VGSAEIAGASTDLILARQAGSLHAFGRDAGDRSRLRPARLTGNSVRATIAGLLS